MTKFIPPKLEVKYADWMSDGDRATFQVQFDKWYDTHIKPLFENAVEVRGSLGGDAWVDTWWYDKDSQPAVEMSHSALLINIQKIEPESAEDILRELVKAMNDTCIIEYKGTPPNTLGINSAFAKARQFLEKK